MCPHSRDVTLCSCVATSLELNRRMPRNTGAFVFRECQEFGLFESFVGRKGCSLLESCPLLEPLARSTLGAALPLQLHPLFKDRSSQVSHIGFHSGGSSPRLCFQEGSCTQNRALQLQRQSQRQNTAAPALSVKPAKRRRTGKASPCPGSRPNTILLEATSNNLHNLGGRSGRLCSASPPLLLERRRL